MEIEVDKRGIGYGLGLIASSVVIMISVRLIAHEAAVYFWRTELPAQQDVVLLDTVPAAENEFYLDPRSEKPVFLSTEELEKKRDALIWEGRPFAVLDLNKKSLSRYENGSVKDEFAIAGLPKTGSLFDAPQGFYTVQGKAERHISMSGRSRVSWAVYLFGNYLIHALPGRGHAAAASSPSEEAGIALNPADARTFYHHALQGMPVLVMRATPAAQDVSFAYVRRTLLPQRVPEVTAAAALGADLDTGEVLFEKNPRDAYPAASLTKLMTAIVAGQEVKPERALTVTDDALKTYGNSAGLARGEVLTSADLLRGLILASSNDIAVMFQAAVPDLVKKMNEKARDLGLAKTYFEDASGLSQNNVTSAGDLLLLLKELAGRHPDLLDASRAQHYTARPLNKKPAHVWTNVNWPAGDKRYLGGKAGFTDESIQTMAGVWSARMSEYGGRRIAIALLGSRNRVRDARAIIAYLEHDFVYGYAANAGQRSRPAAAALPPAYQAAEKAAR